MRLLAIIFCILFTYSSLSQKKSAFVSGKVVDDNEHPLGKISVSILGRQSGTLTSDSGTFRIKVPVDKAFAIVFSSSGYRSEQRNFLLTENEEEKITIRLEASGKILETVVITTDKERNETGLTRINPKNALVLPSTVGGVEGLIKILVGSNNELTSQYSVGAEIMMRTSFT